MSMWIKIEEIIKKPNQIFAHRRLINDKTEYETLVEHTLLCRKYFDKIFQQKEIHRFLQRFKEVYFGELSSEAETLFQKMFVNVISFHDVGKCNPAFQHTQMNRKEIDEAPIHPMDGTQHSIYSAILYVNFWFSHVFALKERAEKELFFMLLFQNAYLIARHHSDLSEFERFCNMFKNDEHVQEIQKEFQGSRSFLLEKPCGLPIPKLERILETLRKHENEEDKSGTRPMAMYTYTRLLYSLLVTSDYYATTEFMSGFEMKNFGQLEEIRKIMTTYEKTSLQQKIRTYENSVYGRDANVLVVEKDINAMRSEMFLDAERTLLEDQEKNIFFLEAPTGSGKSNTALNLSFQLMKENSSLQKIFYIYPFNTLIEQNKDSLGKIFSEHEDIMELFATVNSANPIPQPVQKEKISDHESSLYYQKTLLDRQFLNYPMILSTHVSLFQVLFDNRQESLFAFHQLAGSVIVLDEIQSYKNSIWAEIIAFLQMFSDLLHMKIIIMSATLPDLNYLYEGEDHSVSLVCDREKYFSHSLFRKRVRLDYSLLDVKANIKEILLAHVIKMSRNQVDLTKNLSPASESMPEKSAGETRKMILIEFVRKRSAYEFYDALQKAELDCPVFLITGDDNRISREKVLKEIQKLCRKRKEDASDYTGAILVGTQVVEAGIDIDMDVGYKNISLLDAEEQFLGRINRTSEKGRQGRTYFFNMDEAAKLYTNDVRAQNMSLRLMTPQMREYLTDKNFKDYYLEVMKILKTNFRDSRGNAGIQHFFHEHVKKLNFPEVAEQMRLIDEDRWEYEVFLAREITDMEDRVIDGREVWQQYVSILKDNEMDYAQRKVKLSNIKSDMNYFIYKIPGECQTIVYDERVGDLFYVENGDNYIKNDKLDWEIIFAEDTMFL